MAWSFAKHAPPFTRRCPKSTACSCTDNDAGNLEVFRVVVRALNTDPSIEAAIRDAVEAEKRLEAKQVQVEIAKKDAEIEIARARGIAEANRIINSSLPPFTRRCPKSTACNCTSNAICCKRPFSKNYTVGLNSPTRVTSRLPASLSVP